MDDKNNKNNKNNDNQNNNNKTTLMGCDTVEINLVSYLLSHLYVCATVQNYLPALKLAPAKSASGKTRLHCSSSMVIHI